MVPVRALLAALYNECHFRLGSIRVGEANASIASTADLIISVPSGKASEFVEAQAERINKWLGEEYKAHDPNMHCTISP